MKLKLYLFVTVLFVYKPVFSQQHFVDPVAQNSTDFSGTGTNINEAYHCCNCTIANPNSSKPIPAVVTTHFKIPANGSIYSTKNSYNNTVRVQSTCLNAGIVLSKSANYNTRASFKNSNNYEVKTGIIDPGAGRSICEKQIKRILITVA